ncbi:MAG: sigma-70 family RNA polymerase sigma factor [Bacteroidales bacterium]|nr:sigma-70 family RNA polymerase sigma factor [Bacteroidales bacterium]
MLKSNDWEKLRTFQFQSTLFNWLKIVAIHYFNNNKEKILPNYFTSRDKSISSQYQILKGVPKDEITSMLKFVRNQQYQNILYFILIEGKTDKQIIDLLSVSDKVYRRKKHFALECLQASLINAESHFAELYFKEDNVFSEKISNATSTSDNEIVITKMDVATILMLMPNDRYRFVIRSLVLEDRDRNEVAQELGIKVQNLDNIKSRALKQLAEIARKELK